MTEMMNEYEDVAPFKPKKPPLLVGIDLGTYRTAITSNRGDRFLIRSVVGEPKDLISSRMVGDGPLVGKEAMERRNYLDLPFPLADGVIREASDKDRQAAHELLRHAVDLVRHGEDVEVSGIIGVPARATAMNKELLLSVAKEVMASALVVSEPFMVAYALNKLSNCIVVDIGAGTVDICGMKGTVPTPDDQVTILKGGAYLDERLASAIGHRYPGVQITPSLACKIKETYAFVGKSTAPISVTLRADGKPAQFDVTDEIRGVCESIVPEIVEQIETLIVKFDPENQEETLLNIYLAGGGSLIKGLDRMIAEHLEDYGPVRVTCVDTPEYIGSAGALKLAVDIPAHQWHQIGVMFGASAGN